MKRGWNHDDQNFSNFRTKSMDSCFDDDIAMDTDRNDQNDALDAQLQNKYYQDNSIDMASGDDNLEYLNIPFDSSMSIANKRIKFSDPSLKSRFMGLNGSEPCPDHFVRIKTLEGFMRIICFKEQSISVRKLKQLLEEEHGYSTSSSIFLYGKGILTDYDYVPHKAHLFMVAQFYG